MEVSSAHLLCWQPYSNLNNYKYKFLRITKLKKVRNLNILPRKESERTGILHILRIIEESKKFENIYQGRSQKGREYYTY